MHWLLVQQRFASLLKIIGVFVLSWAVSILIYRLNRYDEIEVNADPAD